MSRTDAYFPSGRDRHSLFFRSRGFSIVELLVSLCILGVLASLAAPYLGTMLQNYQVQAAARQLVTDLQFAKMRAVAQKVNYQVTFDAPNNRYTVSTGAVTIFTRNLSDYSRGVTLTENFAGDAVIFLPIGQASATGTATFTASGNSTKVTVTLAGGVYVQ